MMAAMPIQPQIKPLQNIAASVVNGASNKCAYDLGSKFAMRRGTSRLVAARQGVARSQIVAEWLAIYLASASRATPRLGLWVARFVGCARSVVLAYLRGAMASRRGED